jgi:uncharacterized membrane protein
MNTKLVVFLALIIVSFLAGFAGWRRLAQGIPDRYSHNDIAYIWEEGQRIYHHENPYSRIHGGNLQVNEKYPTSLPGIYLVIAGVRLLGIETFDGWLRFWIATNVVCHFGVGLILYWILARQARIALGMFAFGFWCFSRWALLVVWVGQVDNVAILVLVMSLLTLRSRPNMGYLLLGISLSLKHMALFLIPLYVVDAVWNSSLKGKSSSQSHIVGGILGLTEK